MVPVHGGGLMVTLLPMTAGVAVSAISRLLLVETVSQWPDT